MMKWQQSAKSFLIFSSVIKNQAPQTAGPVNLQPFFYGDQFRWEAAHEKDRLRQ